MRRAGCVAASRPTRPCRREIRLRLEQPPQDTGVLRDVVFGKPTQCVASSTQKDSEIVQGPRKRTIQRCSYSRPTAISNQRIKALVCTRRFFKIVQKLSSFSSQKYSTPTHAMIVRAPWV